ncbi:MAG: TolC family protein [Candidatus Omnitrophota bacterium]
MTRNYVFRNSPILAARGSILSVLGSFVLALVYVTLFGIVCYASEAVDGANKGVLDVENFCHSGDEKEAVASENFGLSLDDCVEIAIANSKDIKISSEKIILAKIKKTAAIRDLFPTLSLYWNTTKGTKSDISEDYRGTQYGLDAEHEIWPRDQMDYSYKQTEKNLKFNETDYKRVKSDLIYEVKKTFFELAKAKKNLSDQKSILAKASELYDLAQKEKASGLISQLEFLKSLSKYREVDSEVNTKEYIVKLAGVKLRNVLRLDDSTYAIDIDDGNLFTDKDKSFFTVKGDSDELLNSYVETALLNRLEIKMQKTKVEFYEYGKKAVAGKGKPKISFVGTYKKVGDAFKPNTIDFNNEWFVGAKVAFPWFGNTLEYTCQTGVSVPNRTSTYSTFNESDVQNQSIKLGVMSNLPYYYERKESEIAYQSALKEEEDESFKVILEVNESFFGYKDAVNKAMAAVDKLNFAIKELEVSEVMRASADEAISQSLESLSGLQQSKVIYNETLFGYYVSILELNKAVNKDVISIQ